MADEDAGGDRDDSPAPGAGEDPGEIERVDSTPADDTGFESVPGIGPGKAAALRDAGFTSLADLTEDDRASLTRVPGVGSELAERLIAASDGDDDQGAGASDNLESWVAEDEWTEETTDYAHDGISGPDEDREMPLADHIEEMLKRLAVVVAIAGVVSLATFPAAEGIINFLWNSVLPGGEITRPRLYGILELKLTELKVASLAGLIVALPVLVYQTYQFMRPGLYHHERRYYLAAIPTSLVLALVGVSFAYFIILPAIFTYFLYYSQDVAPIGFALGRTFNLILLLMGYMALVFQIPLFIMLAMMMGLVTRRWLVERRILFWGAFLGISFIFSPDPTGMAPIVVALTMVALFEGTLLLTKWTRRGATATG